MFGYKLVKNVEIENLKEELVFCKKTIDSQDKETVELNKKIREYEIMIEKLNLKIKEQEGIISNTMVVKNESNDEKPVKKVRRKSSKKNTKKEI